MFRFSDPANVAKSLLDGNRDHLLAEARSELMKEEYEVESLNTCIGDLKQQTCAQRLQLEDAHHGYVESRWEQVIPPLTRCTNLERSQRRSSCEASLGDHFPATSDCVVNELRGEKLKKA